eukprot:142785_1
MSPLSLIGTIQFAYDYKVVRLKKAFSKAMKDGKTSAARTSRASILRMRDHQCQLTSMIANRGGLGIDTLMQRIIINRINDTGFQIEELLAMVTEDFKDLKYPADHQIDPDRYSAMNVMQRRQVCFKDLCGACVMEKCPRFHFGFCMACGNSHNTAVCPQLEYFRRAKNTAMHEPST